MPVKAAPAKAKTAKERNRKVNSILPLLLSFDQSIKESHGQDFCVIGVDEVGIGCFAGPVVAAATILPPMDCQLADDLARLNDSKKLNHTRRKELSSAIRQHAHFSIASATVEEIDEINILQAGFLAMRRAILELMAKLAVKNAPVLVLVDGNKKIPQLEHEQRCIIQGDAQSASIAAASVIAKVYRDELMDELAKQHPHYSWHTNKGYGSLAHRQAIAKHGLTIWHRRSFNTGSLESDD